MLPAAEGVGSMLRTKINVNLGVSRDCKDYNIAELLADKCIYTEIMDKTGASSAIISRVSRVLSADDSVLRALLEAEKKSAD